MFGIIKSIKSSIKINRQCKDLHDKCVNIIDQEIDRTKDKINSQEADDLCGSLEYLDYLRDTRKEMSSLSIHNEKRYKKKYDK